MTSVTVETPSGSKTLSVCCGDAAGWEKPLDVMTVSAFAGDYTPVPRTMIAALEQQGISVSALAAQPALDLRDFSHVWLSEQIQNSRLPISRIGCIEMRQPGRHPSEQESDILSAIRAYFRMLDLASVSGMKIRTLALPILGTGNQALSLELIAPPVISECLRYLRLNEDIQEISIFARSASKAYRMAKALDSSYALVRSRNEKPKQPGGDLPLAFISYAGADRNVADNLCASWRPPGFRSGMRRGTWIPTTMPAPL